MYTIGAVLKKGQAKLALYDKDYKCLIKKDGEPKDLSRLCSAVISEGGITLTDIDSIGLAVDSEYGTASDVAVKAQRDIGVRCHGASVIDAEALGEAYMSDDVPFLVKLKIDTAVECGIVIDRKIYAGEYSHGERFSHMVINAYGYECTCGGHGCFEAYASLSGIRRIAADAGVERAEELDHEALFAMNTPSAECAKALYIEYLACGIVNIINLFQPNELVLEGAFADIGDALMTPLTEIILREQYSCSMPNKCIIRHANDRLDTVLLGAALLGR